jgi:HPt (histidine-containing phosphotransfer) domain-containing protein
MDDCLTEHSKDQNSAAALPVLPEIRSAGSGDDGCRFPSGANAVSFEPDDALSRMGGHLDLLLEVARRFVTQAPHFTAEIRDAMAAQDPAWLMRAAHNLKGVVSYFGTGVTGTLAGKLELLCKNKDPENLRQAVTAIEADVVRLGELLVLWIEQAGGEAG